MATTSCLVEAVITASDVVCSCLHAFTKPLYRYQIQQPDKALVLTIQFPVHFNEPICQLEALANLEIH